MQLSIIIPVLNEASHIDQLLRRLQPLQQRGAQLIVVDGGSSDATLALAADALDNAQITNRPAPATGAATSVATATDNRALLLQSPRGRAAQMNLGAQQATGDVLLFLHADTVLPEPADKLIARALADASIVWGRFDVRIDAAPRMFRVIETMMNWRSRWTGISTGDQALFVRRKLFAQLGGFAPIALMEDIQLCQRLKRHSRPACLRERVQTSARRWQRHGVWRTIWLMWRLRLAYFFGADPQALARRYGQH